MHRDTTSLSYLLGVHPSFLARITCFSLSLLSFSKWILLLLVQVKHKRTLYKFLLQKQKCAGIMGVEIQNTTNKHKWQEKCK